MPIDGSGNFSRSYDFEQDRTDGIKILAARVDGEFDNYAAALNQGFWRTGIVPLSGNLKMGANKITGLGSGSASSPSTQFNSAATTGIYLSGANNLGIASNGVSVAEFSSVGFDGAGVVRAKGNGALSSGAGTELIYNASTQVGKVLAYDRGAVVFKPIVVEGSSVTLSASGVTTAVASSAGFSVAVGTRISGTNTQATGSGVEVLHNGTTGTVQAYDRSASLYQPLGLLGSAVILSPNGVNKAQFNPTGTPHSIVGDTGFTGNVTVSGNVTAGTLGISGASNLGPVNAGAVSISSLGVAGDVSIGGNIGLAGGLGVGTTLTVAGLTTLANLAVNSNQTIGGTLGVTSNATVGGTLGVTGLLTPSGGVAAHTVTGDITRNTMGPYLYHGTARASAKITVSSSSPSGGSDGDMWLQY